MRNFIESEIKKLRDLVDQILSDAEFLINIEHITSQCIESIKKNKKIIFAGNGGSAADSQHLAAELVSRLKFDRPGLPAIAITTDTSALTAISNDYGYEYVFARQLESIGTNGDIFFAISTSGKSPNIIAALKTAKKLGIITVGLAGKSDYMQEYCDYIIKIPSTETPKIQECHIMLGHIICAAVEDKIYGETHFMKKQNIKAKMD